MANKKINQLVSKTAILSTDLFGIGDATTGQLFKKTIAELQAAIGGAVISVNGLVGTVVLDTDDIQELANPTNKYFTDARARAAISLTVTGNSGASTYSSGTGILNVPTYTLAGLGGITASFLSGTSGISYNSTTGVISYSGTVYTDASIRALFSGSTGITYNSSTGAISYSGTVYTDSSVRALISMTTTGNSGASTYNNTTGVINVPDYTLAGLGGISLTSLSGGTGITYNSSTGAISYSGTVYTDASVRALISLTTTGTSGASTYNSTTGVLNIPQYQGVITLTTTGTSGAATFSANTLNIPQYQSVLTNPVTGTGTSGHVTYWNGSGSIAGSANHFWDNTNGRLGIGTASPSYIIDAYSTSASAARINIGGTTNFVASQYTNTSGAMYIGIDDSAGANFTGTAYGRFIYSSGAYPFIFNINGSERMRITSTGNVGIGTTTPVDSGANYKILTLNGTNSGILRIQHNGTSAGDFESDATNTYLWELRNANLSFGTNSTERMRITSDGNVGIGTSSPNVKLDVRGINTTTGGFISAANSNASQFVTLYGGQSSDLYSALWWNSGQTAFKFATATGQNGSGESIKMLITSTGNILMGTETDNGERLYVSGAIRATSTITANSDIRIKSNITKIENALEKVCQISGYTYNTNYDDKRHGGVIAQEIDKVFPEIVNTGNDGLMGVEYGNISALLIEAIKEQKKEIDELRTIIASK